MPAQPTDFQAEAESDTRIQLSWLLPPQERITKYELLYWEAEAEEQQVSPASGQCLALKPILASPWDRVSQASRPRVSEEWLTPRWVLRKWLPSFVGGSYRTSRA